VAETSALAVYAAGVAFLEEEETAVQRLVELADGDTGGLRDAQDLLHQIDAHPDRVERASLLIERAITRVAEARRTVESTSELQRDTRRTRQHSGDLRRRARRLRDGDGPSRPPPDSG
jgi:hypothetical protein